MLPLRLFDPARARTDGRRLLAALGASVAAHVVAGALWASGASAPAERVALAEYPATFTLTNFDPAPAGGGGPSEEAPPPPPDEPPAPLPLVQEVAPDEGIPTPVAQPVETPRPTPTPPTRTPDPPPAPLAASGTASGGTAPVGTGGGTGGGAGTGAGPGTGPGDRGGSGVAGGTGIGPPATVREPERPPRLVSLPLPINPPESQRGDVRGRARVEVLVDERGGVAEARIVERLRLGRGDREEAVETFPAGVDAAVLGAARRLRFRPAQHETRPVRAYATVTLSVGV